MKKIVLSFVITLIVCYSSVFLFSGCSVDSNVYQISISENPTFSWVDRTKKGYEEAYEQSKEAAFESITFTFTVNGEVRKTPKLDEDGKIKKDADGKEIMEVWENLSYKDFLRLGGFVTVNLYDESTTTMRVSWHGHVQTFECTVQKTT